MEEKIENKKKKKDFLPVLLMILGILVIVLMVFILKDRINLDVYKNTSSKSFADCIAEKSELYTQIGCLACERQKEIFEEDYEKISVINCWDNKQRCLENNITATPTWIIDNKKYTGIKSIEELKEITGC